MISQLNLYANLCADRNSACCDYFQQIFSFKTLQKCVLNPELQNNMRSIFCMLIRNIYLDKEPRNIKHKPNLNRIIDNKKIKHKKSFYFNIFYSIN